MEEMPNTRADQYVCISAGTLALAGAVWLAAEIWRGPDQNHTAAFVGLALLLGFAAYLAPVLVSLRTVRYTLTGNQLIVSQWRSQAALPLGPGTHVHRWRGRWLWDGGLQKDLAVEAVGFFPVFWLVSAGDTWVVDGSQPDGPRRAVAIRPSPALVAALRERTQQRAG